MFDNDGSVRSVRLVGLEFYGITFPSHSICSFASYLCSHTTSNAHGLASCSAGQYRGGNYSALVTPRGSSVGSPGHTSLCVWYTGHHIYTVSKLCKSHGLVFYYPYSMHMSAAKTNHLANCTDSIYVVVYHPCDSDAEHYIRTQPLHTIF